jgi:hypothetical protein
MPIVYEFDRRPLPAQPNEIARSAHVLVPSRKTRKLIRAERFPSLPDLVAYGGQQRVVDRLTSRLTLLVEVQHLDQVGGLSSELLVLEGVNVELVAGDLLGLGAFSGLEVHDRHLASVQAANEVDTAVDGDARCNVDLDLLRSTSTCPT